MRRACVMVLVAACGSNPPVVGDDAAVDATHDAYAPVSCSTDDALTAITATGTSPGGSLDVFHVGFAWHGGGDCPDAYIISLRPDRTVCTNDPLLVLSIPAPFAGENPHAASAVFPDHSEFATDQLTFEATQLDDPSVPSPRIAGRFVSHDPAWVFDIEVDLRSLYNAPCI